MMSRELEPPVGENPRPTSGKSERVREGLSYLSMSLMAVCALLVVIFGHFTARSLNHAAQGPGDPDYDAATRSADAFQLPIGVLWVLAMALAVVLAIIGRHRLRRWNIGTVIFGVVGIPIIGVAGVILGIFAG